MAAVYRNYIGNIVFINSYIIDNNRISMAIPNSGFVYSTVFPKVQLTASFEY